jgi:hypothetical protein
MHVCLYLCACVCMPIPLCMCDHDQALAVYWATSGAYSMVQNVALEVPAVRRALGVRPMPSDTRTVLHAWAVAAREGRLARTLFRLPQWPSRPFSSPPPSPPAPPTT